MAIEVDQQSLRASILAFRGSAENFKRAAIRALEGAGEELKDAVKQGVARPPIGGTSASHREALAGGDHPYARRQGSIQFSPIGALAGVPPELQVHTVDGKMLASLFGTFDEGQASYTVGFDATIAPHASYVVTGTNKMLPRPIIQATLNSPFVLGRMQRAFINGLRGTQAIIRFEP